MNQNKSKIDNKGNIIMKKKLAYDYKFENLSNEYVFLPKSEAIQYKSLKTQKSQLEEDSIIDYDLNENTKDKKSLLTLKYAFFELNKKLKEYFKILDYTGEEQSFVDYRNGIFGGANIAESFVYNAVKNGGMVESVYIESIIDSAVIVTCDFQENTAVITNTLPQTTGFALKEMLHQRNIYIEQFIIFY